MATALFLSSIAIAGAINPDWVVPEGNMEAYSWAFGLFVAYDLLTLIARFKSK